MNLLSAANKVKKNLKGGGAKMACFRPEGLRRGFQFLSLSTEK